jgi:predicted transposase YdaD
MGIIEAIKQIEREEAFEKGIEKGRVEGRVEGIEKGKAEGKADVIENMLLLGKFSVSEIANFVNVSESLVRKIKSRLKK